MRNIQAIDKQTGEVRSPFAASDVSEVNRDRLAATYNYTCLNPNCGCTFHWRKSVRRRGNQQIVPPTFVKNPSSEHIAGCHYDYARFAFDNPSIAYVKDDTLHIRINFPLGTHQDDLYPPTVSYSSIFNNEGRNLGHQSRVKKEPVDSLRKLVDLLEKQFGSLESPALADVAFDYQGHIMHWHDMYVASNNYKKLYLESYDADNVHKTSSLLSIVKPLSRIANNAEGRPRFSCEAQNARPHSQLKSIKPIFVCANEVMAGYIDRVIAQNEVMMVAARPFPAQKEIGRVKDHNVYLYAHDVSQLARVDKEMYWHLIPDSRHQLSMMDRLLDNHTDRPAGNHLTK